MEHTFTRITYFFTEKPKLTIGLLFAVLVTLYVILISLSTREIGSDDYIFIEQTKPFHTVYEWLVHRYETWSGRLLPESLVYFFSQNNLLYWKIVSVLNYIVYITTLFLYYKLFIKKRTNTQDILTFLYIGVSIYLLGPVVFDRGALWVTGAMNYFWIITLLLVGLYPLLHLYKKNTLPKITITTPLTIILVLAIASQEQVGLLGLMVIGLLLIDTYLKKRKFPHPYYIATLVLSSTAFLAAISAPGNRQRVVAETQTWLPDYYTAPLVAKVDSLVRWFVEAIVNHNGQLLLLLSGALLFLAITTTAIHGAQKKIFIVYSTVIFALFVIKGQPYAEAIYNFNATWQPQNLSRFEKIIPYVWLMIITTLPYVLYRLTKNKRVALISLAPYVLYILTVAPITLSPTLYASGWRTLFIPSLTLSICVGAFLLLMLRKRVLYSQTILTVVLIFLACFGYFYHFDVRL